MSYAGHGLRPVLRYNKQGRPECIAHPEARIEECPQCYQRECVRCRDLLCQTCQRPWLRKRPYRNPDLLQRLQGWLFHRYRRRG